MAEMLAFSVHNRLDVEETDVEFTGGLAVDEEGWNIISRNHAAKSTSELPSLSMVPPALPI